MTQRDNIKENIKNLERAEQEFRDFHDIVELSSLTGIARAVLAMDSPNAAPNTSKTFSGHLVEAGVGSLIAASAVWSVMQLRTNISFGLDGVLPAVATGVFASVYGCQATLRSPLARLKDACQATAPFFLTSIASRMSAEICQRAMVDSTIGKLFVEAGCAGVLAAATYQFLERSSEKNFKQSLTHSAVMATLSAVTFGTNAAISEKINEALRASVKYGYLCLPNYSALMNIYMLTFILHGAYCYPRLCKETPSESLKFGFRIVMNNGYN